MRKIMSILVLCLFLLSIMAFSILAEDLTVKSGDDTDKEEVNESTDNVAEDATETNKEKIKEVRENLKEKLKEAKELRKEATIAKTKEQTLLKLAQIEKECKKCNIVKSKDKFYKKSNAADGYQGVCKECQKQ